MDYEEIIANLNSDIDDQDSQREAKELQNKLKKRGYMYLYISSSILALAFIAFIVLLILGLRSLNATILFSIIPFIFMVLSIFGIFFGVSYKTLSKQIIIKNKNG